jgi:hypothetical protein
VGYADRPRGYRVDASSITLWKGTRCPSRCHHLASHAWQVVKEMGFPPTVIAIEMRSPCRQVGQTGFGFRRAIVS